MRSSRHRGFTLALEGGFGLSSVVPQAIASALTRSLFLSDAQPDSFNGIHWPQLASGANLSCAPSVTGRPRRYGPSSTAVRLGWQTVTCEFTTYGRQQERQVLLHGRKRRRLDITNPLPRMNFGSPNGAGGHHSKRPDSETRSAPPKKGGCANVTGRTCINKRSK